MLFWVLAAGGCARRAKGPSEHDLVMESLNLYEAGIVQELKNDLDGAEAAFQKSLQTSPRPIVHYRLAVVQSKQGQYDQALANLDRALELASNLVIAKKERVRVEALREIRAEGREVAAPVEPPAKPPTVAPVKPPLIKEAELSEAAPPKKPLAKEEKKPQAAIVAEAPESEKESVESPPAAPSPARSPEVELVMAQAYEAVGQGDLDGAIRAYQQALLTDPDDARIHYNLGNLFQRQGKFKKAYLRYQRAIELNIDYGRAWNNLGFVLEKLSRSEEALDCYDQAIAAGEVPEAYYNAALLLEKKGRLEPALDRYRAYVEKAGPGDLADEARQHIRRLERSF